MVEMQVAEQHDANTALFGQGELRSDRAGIEKHGVVNQEPATLLPDRPIHCTHETIRPMATQHSYLHRKTVIF
jgi:hypothetical protein